MSMPELRVCPAKRIFVPSGENTGSWVAYGTPRRKRDHIGAVYIRDHSVIRTGRIGCQENHLGAVGREGWERYIGLSMRNLHQVGAIRVRHENIRVDAGLSRTSIGANAGPYVKGGFPAIDGKDDGVKVGRHRLAGGRIDDGLRNELVSLKAAEKHLHGPFTAGRRLFKERKRICGRYWLGGMIAPASA